MSLEFLQNNKKENKTESLEEQLEKAREDGRILNKKLQEGGGLSHDDPYAYREKEYISENDISAFQLDALLHEPLKDKDGNPVLSIEGKTLSAKEVLEQKQFRKVFVKDMANDARGAINNEEGYNAWFFLIAYNAYNQTLSSEQKKNIDKLFEEENMEQKSIEEVLSNNIFQKVLTKRMASDARIAINNNNEEGYNAWCFLIASDAYNQTFSSKQKEDIDKLFEEAMEEENMEQKSIEEVLFNNVFQKVLVKRMAHNARVVINKEYGYSYNARNFLTASDAYNQTFSSEQKEDMDKLFEEAMEEENIKQKSIKEVLSNNVFQKAFTKRMANDARIAINDEEGENAWYFLRAFKSVNALISFYHKEAGKDRAKKELSSNKEEKLPPMFPQRDF